MRLQQSARPRRTRHGFRATIAIILAIAPFMASSIAAADGSADQKNVVEQLAAELNKLNDRIAALADRYGELQGQKATLDTEISTSSAMVAAEQLQLDQLQATLTELAVSRFVGGDTPGLTPLFSSAVTYMEAQQFDALTAVAYDTGSGSADDLKHLVDQHDADVAKLQQQQQSAVDLLASLEQQKSDGERLISEYTAKSVEAKAKYGELVQLEADRQAEAEAAAAAAKYAQATPAPATNQPAASAPRGSGGSTPSAPATSVPTVAPPPAASGGNSDGTVPGPSDGVAVPPAEPAPAPEPAPEPVAAVPSPSSRAGIAVEAARSVLGTPYVAFQASPSAGFDCSGLTMWAWAQAGVSLPHYSKAQFESLPHIPFDQAQAGDLIFYYFPISHVGLYIGGGQMIDSPHTGAVVRLVTVKWGNVVGVSRPG